MSAEIIPFDFEELAVRVVMDDDGQPWFVAKDVCTALGITWKGSHNLGSLEEDERESVMVDTLGGTQELLTVNESGLYALIFKSRKPQAKRFRKWVTAEILPAIRKYGRYELPDSSNIANHHPQSQADTLINAGRIFREVTRLVGIANKAKPETLSLANAATTEATGLDLLDLLERNGWQAPALQQQAELEAVTQQLRHWLEEQGGTEYSSEQLMAVLGIMQPGNADYALLARVMQTLGWRAQRIRTPSGQRRGYRKSVVH